MPWQSNLILAGLGASERDLLFADLEPVTLTAGDVLQEAGATVGEVYFPCSGIISLLATGRDGATTELAMVGKEGLAGIAPLFGDTTETHRLVVQSTGEAYRLEAGILRWELAQGGRLQRLALRFARALLVQIGQNLLCASHHGIEQRLARWLLLCLDRQTDTVIGMTQEGIAGLLGVRREMVTLGFRRLQAAGILNCHRGRIAILDRSSLEASACECHAAIRAEYARYGAMLAEQPLPARLRAHPASLRQSALARWRDRPAAETGDLASAEVRQELEIRKIELEISNEALHQAFASAEALSERYADIYDFAPVGYFTLDAAGNMLDLNLAGAIRLGLKRSQKRRQGFASYLEEASREPFRLFVARVLQEKSHLHCDIVLAATALRPASKVRIEAVADEAGTECRMVLMDSSDQPDGAD